MANALTVAAFVLLLVAASLCATGCKRAKTVHASVASLGIDGKSADLLKLIEATRPLAKEWQSDAAFFQLDANGVGADGNIDLSKGRVEITWVSRSRVTSEKESANSIKVFKIQGDDVDYSEEESPAKAWTGFEETPIPKCKPNMKDLVTDGFGGLDSKLMIGRHSFEKPNWHAHWGGEKYRNAFFEVETCEPVKEGALSIKGASGDW